MMKIGLLMEDSQKGKNDLVYAAVLKECEKHGHELFNYGMYNGTNPNTIKYYQLGVAGSILLDAGAVDFIITGCGTGQGAMLSMNSFVNIVCGHATMPLDAFLFTQVNAGNAISLAFSQGFGWGAELNVADIVDKLFAVPFGQGYPEHYAQAQALSRDKFAQLKQDIMPSAVEQIKHIDKDTLKTIIDYPQFKTLFAANAVDCAMTDYIKTVLNI